MNDRYHPAGQEHLKCINHPEKLAHAADHKATTAAIITGHFCTACYYGTFDRDEAGQLTESAQELRAQSEAYTATQ